MPSLSGDTFDAEQGPADSASAVLAEAIEELEGKISGAQNKDEQAEDSKELAILRRAANALKDAGGDRNEAISWLKEQATTVVNPEAFEAAAKWLEHLKD
ncbi:MAG: hypothetical protein WC866_03975 [Patescibacteria group bacterium]